LLAFFLIFVPYLYGVLMGLLLLDERDARTLTALRITPLTPCDYLQYRLMVPLLLSLICYLGLLPLLPMALPGFGERLALAVPGMLQTAILALLLSTTVPNKVAGLALYKVLGLVYFAPLVILFFEGKWIWLLAVLPGFWQTSLISTGEVSFTLLWLVGVCYHTVLLGMLARRFARLRLD